MAFSAVLSAMEVVPLTLLTLDDCHVGYRQAQEHKRLDEALSKGVAELELRDEGDSKPSDDELKLQIESAKTAVDLQISAARCIATDDPRLQRPSISWESSACSRLR